MSNKTYAPDFYPRPFTKEMIKASYDSMKDFTIGYKISLEAEYKSFLDTKIITQEEIEKVIKKRIQQATELFQEGDKILEVSDFGIAPKMMERAAILIKRGNEYITVCLTKMS